MPGAVLGRAFQGVTPSFHPLEYQFYETENLFIILPKDKRSDKMKL
jgi:hypothetical protein